jgi:hypothetical protein
MAARRFTINKQDESGGLSARLIACLPAATFEMETLCRLAGIKATNDIPTAAVECTFRPRLLLNPSFIEKHCARDEHLFLLVMHELWHIMLAHTRLYPRATLAHNIAFDAIINAGLSRQFKAPEYRGFFEGLNPGDQFPGCLLRAPEGWPHDPKYVDVGPPGTKQIVMRLYPPGGVQRWSPPLYEEILNLLRQWIKEKIEKGEVIVEPVLLGDHGPDSQDGRALSDPFMGEVLRRVTKNWPPPPFPVSKRGEGQDFGEWFSAIGETSEETRRVFSRVLQHCVGPRYGRQRRKARTPIVGMSGISVIPNARDRMAAARTQLGVQGVLWGQPGTVKARVPETPSRAYIYLDVSGSMNQLLPHLLGLLVPYVQRGQASVFQFSTVVEPLPLDQLKRGHLKTTQGTDINAVLTHALAAVPPCKRILILTDGYTGKPHPENMRKMRERGIRIYAVMPGESAHQADLQDATRSITVLPPVRRR